MGLPKRRHSKSRSRKRRTNWKLKKPSLSGCPKCGAVKLPHQVCPTCGHYKDKKVIEIKEKKKKQK